MTDRGPKARNAHLRRQPRVIGPIAGLVGVPGSLAACAVLALLHNLLNPPLLVNPVAG